MSLALDIGRTYELFKDYAMNRNYKDAMDLIDQAIKVELDPKRIFTEVIARTLKEIQDFREEGYVTVSAFQVLAVAKIAEDAVKKIKDLLTEKKEKTGTIVLGNIQRDHHVLGSEILKVFLESEGWDVIYLGADTPAREFVNIAKENNADLILVSSMMMNTMAGIIDIRELLDRENLSEKIKLMVGGAPFNFNLNLAKKVKADAMGMDVFEAVQYAQQLKKFGKIVDYKAEKKEGLFRRIFRFFKVGRR